MSNQALHIQIRLLVKKRSDLSLHCLPFCLLPLEALLNGLNGKNHTIPFLDQLELSENLTIPPL